MHWWSFECVYTHVWSRIIYHYQYWWMRVPEIHLCSYTGVLAYMRTEWHRIVLTDSETMYECINTFHGVCKNRWIYCRSMDRCIVHALQYCLYHWTRDADAQKKEDSCMPQVRTQCWCLRVVHSDTNVEAVQGESRNRLYSWGKKSSGFRKQEKNKRSAPHSFSCILLPILRLQSASTHHPQNIFAFFGWRKSEKILSSETIPIQAL